MTNQYKTTVEFMDAAMSNTQAAHTRVAIIAGEHSGDHLGGALMRALQTLAVRGVIKPMSFIGVGGEDMAAAGLKSLFPLEDVAVMGPVAIAARLPIIVRRVYQTVDHIIANKPDVLIIIDSPEFTHPIAKRVRARAPDIPIIDYVSPSIWAWRPGRAKKMRSYVDHVLGLLPFEPKAHADLGGPPCTYVGHPLSEKIDEMRRISTQQLELQLQLRPGKPVLVVLPGSRTSEVKRLMPSFAATIDRMLASGADFETVIPALPHVRPLIDAELRKTGVPVYVVEGADFKFQTFRLATCALAASGTVSLELALMQTPMVIAYKVDAVAAQIRPFITANSIVLPNLILEKNVIPEFIQQECTPDKMTPATLALIRQEKEYQAQKAAFFEIDNRMRLPDGRKPSEAAATVVAHYLQNGRGAVPSLQDNAAPRQASQPR